MDSWISFWIAELHEPLTSPLYLVMFVVFLVLSVLGIYAFRGIPHWIIESRQSRLLRILAANIAIVALIGVSVLVLQSMSVPIVNRRIWVGVVVLVLASQIVVLLNLGRFMARQTTSDEGSDLANLDILH